MIQRAKRGRDAGGLGLREMMGRESFFLHHDQKLARHSPAQVILTSLRCFRAMFGDLSVWLKRAGDLGYARGEATRDNFYFFLACFFLSSHLALSTVDEKKKKRKNTRPEMSFPALNHEAIASPDVPSVR